VNLFGWDLLSGVCLGLATARAKLCDVLSAIVPLVETPSAFNNSDLIYDPSGIFPALRSSLARSPNVRRKENGGIRDPFCPIGCFIASAPAGQPRYALIPHSSLLIIQIMRAIFLCRSALIFYLNQRLSGDSKSSTCIFVQLSSGTGRCKAFPYKSRTGFFINRAGTMPS